MKKLLSILMLLVAIVTGAQAVNVKVSRTIAFEATADHVFTGYKDGDNTLITVTDNSTAGTLSGTTSKTRDVKLNGQTCKYSATLVYRNKTGDTDVNGGNYNDNCYVGIKLVIADGYKLTVSQIYSKVAVGSDATKYKLVINDGTNDLYTSEDKTAATNNNSNEATISDPQHNSQNIVLKGTSYLRLYFTVTDNGTSKYLQPLELSLSGALEADNTPSYTMTAAVNNEDYGTAEVSAASVLEGSSATFTATSKTGYKFVNWTNTSTSDVVSAENPYTISSVSGDVSLTANFAAAKQIAYNVTETINGTRTDNLGDYADDNDKFVAPVNLYMSSANQTLTGWSDGETTYSVGDEINCSAGNKTLSPVFENNSGATFAKTLESRTAAFNVAWNMGHNDADFNFEDKTGYYVQQATIAGAPVDIPMYIDAHTNYVQGVSQAKVSNAADNCTTFAQTNNGTIFRVPVINGSVVTLTTYTALSTTTINGSTEYEKSNNDKTATYTYSGETGTIDIVIGEANQYTYTISVSYPAPTPATTYGGDIDFDYSATGANAASWTQNPITVTSNATSIDGSNHFIKSWPDKSNLTVTVAGTNALVSKVILTYQDKNRLPSAITADDDTELTKSGATQTWENTAGKGSVTFTLTGSPRLTGISVEYASEFSALNTAGYGTFSCGSNVQVYGVNAYGAELDEDAKTITCAKVADNKVPAGNGVLLYGKGGDKVYLRTVESASAISSNDLKGTTDANGNLVAKGSDYYYSLKGSEFVNFTGDAFIANKAYFETATELSNSLDIVFTEDEATAVEAIAEAKANAAAPVKVIKNGQLYIGNYNVAGARIK